MLTQGRMTDTGIEWRDKVSLTIERLRQFEPAEGYHLAHSGGKDSLVLGHLAKTAGVRHDSHYSVTGIDPPELVRHLRRHHPDVVWHRPRKTMWQMIVEHHCPPLRQQRWCCEELKETRGGGRIVLTGIRASESIRRSKRQMVEPCKRRGSHFLHPLIDWSEADVWSYIRAHDLPYCSLYDEGWRRLGCIMCPMASTRERLRDAERWPRYYALYLRAFGRMLERRRELGKETRWRTAQEVMDWWLYVPARVDPDQERLPFDSDDDGEEVTS